MHKMPEIKALAKKTYQELNREFLRTRDLVNIKGALNYLIGELSERYDVKAPKWRIDAEYCAKRKVLASYTPNSKGALGGRITFSKFIEFGLVIHEFVHHLQHKRHSGIWQKDFSYTYMLDWGKRPQEIQAVYLEIVANRAIGAIR